MSRPQSTGRASSAFSSAHTEVTQGEGYPKDSQARTKRVATVYDAVAGQIGLNGFLTSGQLLSANLLPSLPEEVLLRRIGAPDEIPYNFYNADQRLSNGHKLPESDLLKAVHSYTSDYFAATTAEQGQRDFRTFDGIALLALGVLLEEASKEVLGKNGDMALTEPRGMENGLPESKMTNHQILGRVKPRIVQQEEEQSDESDVTEQEESPRKRRRARR